MRYIIGIDLGTTNSALAYVDTQQPTLSIHLFPIPQLVNGGKIDPLLTLPSFCYLPASGEWAPGELKLPWKNDVDSFVGQYAKIQGARVPTRLVQSAKSWLSNVAANRREKILPIETDDVLKRLSPVEASAKYLEHLKDAWNALMAHGDSSCELEEQEVILTVPASFDEVARTLTVEAAKKAGFLHLTLIEEPQAAFYSWIAQHEQEWEKKFKQGEMILVCDVGGGTTDFSLIEIQQREGKLSFQRMAVGDHLLLGGDNIDSTLAHYLEQKLKKEGYPSLESHQWLQLKAEARAAKEVLLSSKCGPDENYSIVLRGMGASVVKGSISISIHRKEVESLLLDGFFGIYSFQEALQLRQSRGFRTMGLPYEDEPSITKHLAHFLQQTHTRGIDYVLFNGGTLKPEIFQNAIEQSLRMWFPDIIPKRLESINLDLAVARGAAYFGKVRRGFGVAIGGGIPRTYYLKIDVKDSSGQVKSQALTLLARGSEEGHQFQPSQIFSLRPNTPVVFHLMTSHVRLQDQEGELIDIDPEEMQLLPPIQTILRFGRKQQEESETLPVKLGIRLTEIGTLALWLDSQVSDHQWELEFQLRSATGQDSLLENQESGKADETFEVGYLDEAKKIIAALFKPGSSLKPNQIMEMLESQLKISRREWGSTLLRELWTSLLKVAPYRKISFEHEARWWNLAGFFLRPGYGFPLDDFRLKELWKILLGELKGSKNQEIFLQICICCRRLAGGFNKGQQMQISSELIGPICDKKTGKIELTRKGDLYLYSEKIRALASLERLDLSFKMKLGEALVDRILHQSPSIIDNWALGRIGARHLLYGSAGQVVPRETVTKWIERLLKKEITSDSRESIMSLIKQLARKTDHRELNISETIIQKILVVFPEITDWLLEEKEWSEKEQEQAFGDYLPAGLLLNL